MGPFQGLHLQEDVVGRHCHAGCSGDGLEPPLPLGLGTTKGGQPHQFSGLGKTDVVANPRLEARLARDVFVDKAQGNRRLDGPGPAHGGGSRRPRPV